MSTKVSSAGIKDCHPFFPAPESMQVREKTPFDVYEVQEDEVYCHCSTLDVTSYPFYFVGDGMEANVQKIPGVTIAWNLSNNKVYMYGNNDWEEMPVPLKLVSDMRSDAEELEPTGFICPKTCIPKYANHDGSNITFDKNANIEKLKYTSLDMKIKKHVGELDDNITLDDVLNDE